MRILRTIWVVIRYLPLLAFGILILLPLGFLADLFTGFYDACEKFAEDVTKGRSRAAWLKREKRKGGSDGSCGED